MAGDVKFIRVHGRVVPVRAKGAKSKKKKSGGVLGAVKTGAKYGAGIGAVGGAVATAGATKVATTLMGMDKMHKEAKLFAKVGYGVATPLMAAKGAVKYGALGAGIGLAAGLAQKAFKKKKKK